MTDFGEQFAKEFGLTHQEALDEIKQNSSRALDFNKVYNNRVAERFERLIAQQREPSSDDEELLAHADVRARKNYFKVPEAKPRSDEAKALSKAKEEEAKAKALSKAKAKEEEAASKAKAKAEEAEAKAKAKAEEAAVKQRAKQEELEAKQRAKAEEAEAKQRAKQEEAEAKAASKAKAKAEEAEAKQRAKQEEAASIARAKALSKAATSKAGREDATKATHRAKRAKIGGGEQEVVVAVTPVFDYSTICDIPRETLYYLLIALYFLIHQPCRLEACTDEFVEKVLSKKYLLQIICRMRDVALGQGLKDVPDIDEYISTICKSSRKYPVIPMDDMSSYTKFAYWAMVTSGPLARRFMLDKTAGEIAEHVRNPVSNVQNGFGFFDELMSVSEDSSQRLRGFSFGESSTGSEMDLSEGMRTAISVVESQGKSGAESAPKLKEPMFFIGATPFDPTRELMEEKFISTRPSSRCATPVVVAQKHLAVYSGEEEEEEEEEEEDIWAKPDDLNAQVPAADNYSTRSFTPVVAEKKVALTAGFSAAMDEEKLAVSTTTNNSSVSAFDMELMNQLRVYNENVAGIISLLRQKRPIGDL